VHLSGVPPKWRGVGGGEVEKKGSQLFRFSLVLLCMVKSLFRITGGGYCCTVKSAPVEHDDGWTASTTISGWGFKGDRGAGGRAGRPRGNPSTLYHSGRGLGKGVTIPSKSTVISGQRNGFQQGPHGSCTGCWAACMGVWS